MFFIGAQKYKKYMCRTKILPKFFSFSNYFSNFASDFAKKQQTDNKTLWI
jgi:hypothetical protein